MGFRDGLAGVIATKDSDRPKKYFTARGVVGTTADVLAVLNPIVAIVAFVVAGQRFTEAVLAVTVSLMAIVFMVYAFRLQRRFAHESRRAQAMRELARCHGHLRDAVVRLSDGDEMRFGQDFFYAAQVLAKSYSIATRSPCRVSVKDIEVDGKDPEDSLLFTLCRSESGEREDELPENVRVRDNSDFLALMRGEDVYFSHDLSEEPGYANAHFTKQMKPHEYPYRSTIIWPIKGPGPRGARTRILGFLCVDAEDPRTFIRELDVPIGRAVAHAMYASLSLYRSQRQGESA